MAKPPRMHLETGWQTTKIWPDGATSIRAVVEQSESHGLFRYAIERFFGPAEEDEGHWPDGFWSREERSGLYASFVDAQNEAQSSLDQFRDRCGEDT